MLNVCLCDDDSDVLMRYCCKVETLLNERGVAFSLWKFENGEELLFRMENNINQLDIVILDILMKKINGIQIAQKLRECGYSGIIIFLTTSGEFALDSFGVDPLNYILKQDKEGRFDRIFLKAVDMIYEEEKRRIVVLTKGGNRSISLEHLVYAESFRKKTVFHKLDGSKESINCTLKDFLENAKNQGFIQCHKSYVVNVKFIRCFNALECTLEGNQKIPIGRKYSKEFKTSVIENEFNSILM